MAWINHSEHLVLKSLEKRGNIRAAVGRLQSFVSALQKQLKFIRNDKLGYLTMKPTNLGNMYTMHNISVSPSFDVVVIDLHSCLWDILY